MQMWQGRAQSRCRCGRGEPSPGADAAHFGFGRLQTADGEKLIIPNRDIVASKIYNFGAGVRSRSVARTTCVQPLGHRPSAAARAQALEVRVRARAPVCR